MLVMPENLRLFSKMASQKMKANTTHISTKFLKNLDFRAKAIPYQGLTEIFSFLLCSECEMYL